MADSRFVAQVSGVAVVTSLAFFLAGLRRGRDMANLRGDLRSLREAVRGVTAEQRSNAHSLSATLRAQERKLSHSSERTGSALSDLRVRFAQVDAASRSLRELTGHVSELQSVLSHPATRGAFGEQQLENIVKDVLPPSSYKMQALVGSRRVDCLVLMPFPPGPIGVDAKFPLSAFRDIRDAAAALADVSSSPTPRAAVKEARVRFGKNVRGHVRDVADRYIVPGTTADSALMFVPSEAVYAEIFEHHPMVVEFASKQRVWIVSPTTLWAVLTTMQGVLKDLHLHEKAGIVQSEVAQLLADVERLADRGERLSTLFAKVNEELRLVGISADKVRRRGQTITEVSLGEDSVRSGDNMARAEEAARTDADEIGNAQEDGTMKEL